jgi:hypothetical protein
MLSFAEDRRTFLKVGALGLGGLSLPGLLSARAAGSPVTDRSVVFLFMHGGPAQTETFDPKMGAPSGTRSATGEVKTTLPGVSFGGAFGKLARLAHRLAIVRSFSPGNADHDIKPIVCPETLGANLGSLYARVAGLNHPVTGMPRNAALFPKAVDPAAGAAQTGFGRFDSTGKLGAGLAPFMPGEGGQIQKDMTLSLPKDRLDDRRRLLEGLDRLRREADAAGSFEGVDRFRVQAFDTLMGGVARAFDLSEEDPRTIARYDTAPLVPPQKISTAWKNRRHYADHAATLGKLMLMARRLCEHGCGFVTVTTNFVWDMHADENNATLDEGMRYVGVPFDHAVSAFVEDVEARGLGERILLVACGEMGRTPTLNAKGGRDHWAQLGPLLLYGGGLRMGQVVGESTRDAGEPNTEPVTIARLVATIMHVLLDVPQVRAMTEIPDEIQRAIAGAEPIRELI